MSATGNEINQALINYFKDLTHDDLLIIREALGHLQFNCINQLEDSTPLLYNRTFEKLQKTNTCLNHINAMI